jgi:hypothetical protein
MRIRKWNNIESELSRGDSTASENCGTGRKIENVKLLLFLF